MIPNPLSSVTALLVDDEAYFRKFIGRLLLNEGVASVIESRDGDDAIDLFRVVKPELVILDINMPRKDGVQTLRALRVLSPDVPIVMLTSVADEAVVEQCINEGASAFIRKDVGADDLVRELHETIANAKLTQTP
jgi:two-component system chemotaxis response regulator CheY